VVVGSKVCVVVLSSSNTGGQPSRAHKPALDAAAPLLPGPPGRNSNSPKITFFGVKPSQPQSRSHLTLPIPPPSTQPGNSRVHPEQIIASTISPRRPPIVSNISYERQRWYPPLGGEVGGTPSRSRLTTSVLVVVVVVVVVPLFVRVFFVGGVCSFPWSFSFSVGPWDSVSAIVQHIDWGYGSCSIQKFTHFTSPIFGGRMSSHSSSYPSVSSFGRSLLATFARQYILPRLIRTAVQVTRDI
jgi:hypothetical protein